MNNDFVEKENNYEKPAWGEVFVEDILRNLYKGKSFNNMSDFEVELMLEDLI